MTTLIIHGPLRGKGRPRFSREGHAYTPEATRDYEREIQLTWGNKPCLTGPVEVRIDAYQALPKRATKAQRQAAERGEIWPIRKPDLDNIVKIAMDALNGYAYRDDTQVVRLDAQKLYATGAESRLEITVDTITHDQQGEVQNDGNRNGTV